MEASRKCGPSGGSNSDVLSSIDNVLSNLISENNQYFRKGDFGSIRGVAHCVQDLSSSDCQDCLLEASGRLRSECESSTWGNMYLGKCYIKYATDNGHSGYYTLHSNMYEEAGKWSEAYKIRELIKLRRVKKNLGYSHIQQAKKDCLV
ncbi:cysteine-rich repeat secretory protein 12-like protein [Tanacetum coccineum]